TQVTRYPWDGDVKITVAPEKKSTFTLAVRIPGWARNEPVPGDLYQFADTNTEPVTLAINGKAAQFRVEDGYAKLRRSWTPGDVVELHLPMPVHRVVANPNVKADIGRVALQRGPIVFCAEWPDNPGGKVLDLTLPDHEPLTAQFEPHLLNGVEVIKGRSLNAEKREQPFSAIPYFAWANRGPGEMTVWLHRE
ncbi:MAG: glycoside hydrolase family 127 protein, partial [Limisphaerales bacterium]